VRGLTLVVALALLGAAAAHAQVVPTRPPTQEPSPQDTVKVPPFRTEPPVSPVGAAFRSLLLPGWGQSVLGRRTTGAVFVFWEGVTVFMTLKSVHQLHYQESIDAETVEGKRQEVEDWAVLLAFNHLIAAAEAFVSAQLWDFPANLELRALPGGGVGAGVRMGW
jgi:hypothetical protein